MDTQLCIQVCGMKSVVLVVGVYVSSSSTDILNIGGLLFESRQRLIHGVPDWRRSWKKQIVFVRALVAIEEHIVN